MPSTAPIRVVCALIEREDCLLLAQRPAHKHLPLKWEFPGGKVEPGEPPADAIIREIREELGCEILITHALPPFIHDYKTTIIEMIPFVCTLTPASPSPRALDSQRRRQCMRSPGAMRLHASLRATHGSSGLGNIKFLPVTQKEGFTLTAGQALHLGVNC